MVLGQIFPETLSAKQADKSLESKESIIDWNLLRVWGYSPHLTETQKLISSTKELEEPSKDCLIWLSFLLLECWGKHNVKRAIFYIPLYKENNYLKYKAVASHSVSPAKIERKLGIYNFCYLFWNLAKLTRLISFLPNLCHRVFMWSAPWQLQCTQPLFR